MGQRYSEEFKLEVLEYLSSMKTVFQTASRFRVHPSTIYVWRRNLIRAVKEKQALRPLIPDQETIQKLRERVSTLEHENAVLKEATKIYFQS
jgi:transposase-like protein